MFLLAAKTFLTGFLDFFINHWRAIILALTFLAYSYNVYQYGYNRCDNVWIEENNKTVLANNKIISTLENESHTKVADLEVENAGLRTDMADILAKGRGKSHGTDKSGKTLACGGKTTDVYLGSDFVGLWNDINIRGNR